MKKNKIKVSTTKYLDPALGRAGVAASSIYYGCDHKFVENYSDESLKYKKFVCLMCGEERAIERNTTNVVVKVDGKWQKIK
jgi:hypothetical protein